MMEYMFINDVNRSININDSDRKKYLSFIKIYIIKIMVEQKTKQWFKYGKQNIFYPSTKKVLLIKIYTINLINE